MFAVGSVAGGLATVTRPARRPLAVGYTLSLAYAGMLALIALRAPLPWLALAAVCAGFGISYAEILYEAAVQEHIPGHLLARVTAWDWLGSMLPGPIGFAVVGPIAASIGAPETIAAAAALTALSTCAALLVPDVRNLTHVPPGVSRARTS